MTESLARPPIARTHRAVPLREDTTPDDIAARLLAGEALLLQGSYGQGVRALTALRSEVCSPGADYAARSAQEQRFAALAQNLLAPVSDNRVRLRDVPSNGFLEELYPDASDFVIPLVWVQALHGAWERYTTGVHFPVLGRRLHPHYGVYAPARMVHLELFATWLKGSTGAGEGCRCGYRLWGHRPHAGAARILERGRDGHQPQCAGGTSARSRASAGVRTGRAEAGGPALRRVRSRRPRGLQSPVDPGGGSEHHRPGTGVRGGAV